MNMMRSLTKSLPALSLACAVLSVLFFGGQTALAQNPGAQLCDISDLPCAADGKKCNIKFRNKTGVRENMGCGIKSDSQPSASLIKVKARDEDRDKMGNALTIEVGESNTMNFDNKKKQNFYDIQVSTPNNPEPVAVKLTCEQVRAVLRGNGTCKIYIDRWTKEATARMTGYTWMVASCDGGTVCASSEEGAKQNYKSAD